MEVAANSLVSSSELCMRLIRQAARALYNDSYPNGMAHLCRLPTQIPMKWWPRETLRAGEVVHILGEPVDEHTGTSNKDTLKEGKPPYKGQSKSMDSSKMANLHNAGPPPSIGGSTVLTLTVGRSWCGCICFHTHANGRRVCRCVGEMRLQHV